MSELAQPQLEVLRQRRLSFIKEACRYRKEERQAENIESKADYRGLADAYSAMAVLYTEAVIQKKPPRNVCILASAAYTHGIDPEGRKGLSYQELLSGSPFRNDKGKIGKEEARELAEEIARRQELKVEEMPIANVLDTSSFLTEILGREDVHSAWLFQPSLFPDTAHIIGTKGPSFSGMVKIFDTSTFPCETDRRLMEVAVGVDDMRFDVDGLAGLQFKHQGLT